MELDTLGRGLLVDGWLRLRGWARIGVLVSRLRAMVDALIAARVDGGNNGGSGSESAGTAAGASFASIDVLDRDVVRAVVRLIELDGMDA